MHGLFQRRPGGVTRALVLINCAFFLLQAFAGPSLSQLLVGMFGLSGQGLRAGMLWQPLTHMFLHGNLFHLLVNMITLWFAGRAIENWLGGRSLLLVFLGGGILGGLLQTALFPGGHLIGASGGVCAVLLAVTTLEPEMEITALLFFVLPVRLRAKFLGWGVIGVSMLLALLGVDPHIGHLAHLGGALAGMAWAVWMRRTGRYVSHSAPSPSPRFRTARWSRNPSSQELERVLNKVVREGLHSLTGRERALLESWSQKQS